MSRLTDARIAQAAIAVAAVLLLAPGTAAAGFGHPDPKDPGGGDGGGGGVDGQESEVVGTCVLYANPAGMGADCVSGDGGSSKVDLEILFGGKDRVCRYDLLGPNDPSPDEATPDGPGRWWVERCVERDPKGPDEGQIRYTYDHLFKELEWTPPQLTEAQRRVWIYTTEAYPVPYVDTFPDEPRVLTPTSFTLTGHPTFERTATVYAGPAKGFVTMTASVAQTTFTVEDPAGNPVFKTGGSCSKPYAVLQRNVCEREFRRSTAIFGDDGSEDPGESPKQYFVNTELVWRVTYTTQYDSTTHVLGDFDVQLGRWLRVNEIQTLNLPDADKDPR